jgi:diguanylate cyclase (GGDEF)-like protein
MDYLIFPYCVIFLSLPMAVMTVYLWQNINRQGARSLSTLLICILGWLIFNTIELVTPTESGTLFWAKTAYIFIVSAPVLWLYFVFDYFGYNHWLKFPQVTYYWGIPLITLGMLFSNDWHHLFWYKTTFLPVGSYLALQVTHGPFFYLQWFYSQFLIFFGGVLILRENFTGWAFYRLQVRWIVAGAVLVMVANVVYISGFFPQIHKDYTPIILALGGLCFAIAILRYKFVQVAPINTEILFKSLDDGILVVNADLIIINLNRATKRLLVVNRKDLIGRPLDEVFAAFPAFCEAVHNRSTERFDIHLRENPPCYLNIQLSSIYDRYNILRGQLITIRDATSEKLAQIAEHKAKVFAEALSDIAAALNSRTRNLDELFDLIINSISQVTACDAANIMMIDNGLAHTVRSSQPAEEWCDLSIQDTPSVRQMIETRQPVIITNVEEYPNWIDIPVTRWIKSFIGAPIIAGKEVIGFLNLDSGTPNFYNEEVAQRLSAFANQASIAIQNARIYEKLEKMANIDDLTQLYNRRYFFELAVQEYTRAIRYQRPLSAIMIDLDHFKLVNDSYGHLVGDQVLSHMAAVCREGLRKNDFIGRYGGEEFIILLPETELDEAKAVAERLCRQIAGEQIVTETEKLKITASMGVATLDKSCNRLEDLLSHADQALYTAKECGRNHVKIYSEIRSDADISPN